MTITLPKETAPGETRASLVPAGVTRLIGLGARVEVESGLGAQSGFPDEEYEKAGATVVMDRSLMLSQADIVARLNPPPLEEVGLLKEGCLHVSLLDPFNQGEMLSGLARRAVSAVGLEMLPRITRAQPMDVLSSQANLAGYVAVMLAGERLTRIFPMMTTAAGTFEPARVLVIGAGVAGLQAIATAHRLGAVVSAYDTRPEVGEQVRSVGARLLKIDLGQTQRTEEGYAKPLTDEQLGQLRDNLVRACADADVVITTAQVFGGKAPLLVTAEAVAAMKPGSVVVDLAVASGGNVEGIETNQTTSREGVTLIGLDRLAARVPATASQALSCNFTSFISEFWDREQGRFDLRLEDEVIRSCLVTHAGRICHPLILERNNP